MSELCTNCDNVTNHEVATLDCSGPRPSGVADAVLALCGNSIVDPSDGTQWATAIAGEFAKELFNITGSIDSGDATLAPKTTPCGVQRTLYTTYTGTIVDYNFTSANFDFWNPFLNGVTIPGMLMRLCPKDGWDDVCMWLDGTVSFSGSPVVPGDDAEAARFEITFSFKGNITLVPTPSGVFE